MKLSAVQDTNMLYVDIISGVGGVVLFNMIRYGIYNIKNWTTLHGRSMVASLLIARVVVDYLYSAIASKKYNTNESSHDDPFHLNTSEDMHYQVSCRSIPTTETRCCSQNPVSDLYMRCIRSDNEVLKNSPIWKWARRIVWVVIAVLIWTTNMRDIAMLFGATFIVILATARQFGLD